MRKLIKADMDDELMMSAYLIYYQVLISTSHHLIEKYTCTIPHKKRFAYQINKIMNIKQLNELPITDFLSKIGIEPSYTKGENHWYLSPIREPEHSASFRVNMSINRWYDYALLKGGKLFDLAERIFPNLDASGVVKKINGLFLFEQQNHPVTILSQPIRQSVTEKQRNTPAITIRDIKPLGNNPAISSYLASRGIFLDLARPYCKEVYYKIGDYNYFAAGFENRSGGYELRSEYFKGSTSPKDITHIEQGNKSVCVVEGFIDFLSLLSLRQPEPVRSDFVILNSVSLAERSLDILRNYRTVFVYPDHDAAGSRLLEKFEQAKINCIDASGVYQDYKDLNQMLVAIKAPEEQVRQQRPKRSQGLRM
jgi:5S rRNA maturation endonuclease (ribonuclease M5)